MNFLTKALTFQFPDFKEKSDASVDKIPTGVNAVRYQQIVSAIDEFVKPTVAGRNFLEMFRSIPEVFWPIDFIAKRISEAHYDIKRVKDDSLVWCDRLGLGNILRKPNPLMSWRELCYQFWVYKLCTGNTFFRASMPEGLTEDALKCVYCDNYWVLPSDKVDVVPVNNFSCVPLFGCAELNEIIKGYNLSINGKVNNIIPSSQIWHDRDGIPNFLNASNFLKADSRLCALRKPIANLIAVYEARNVIYTKRGALGFIVSQKKDESGTVALDPDEKKEILKSVNEPYGVVGGKYPFGVTDVPVSFVRTNLSIQELMPFDETLEDAIKIAGVYNIPAVLVPRKDQATFSNQDSAEQSVYYSTIIPAAKDFCHTLTTFLGLDKKGYYIDCNFSDVACLQAGRKEKETCDTLALQRGITAFNAGLCTLDDIRAIIHKDAKADSIPLFGRLKFEMTPEELETVNEIINNITSKGEEHNGESKEPSV